MTGPRSRARRTPPDPVLERCDREDLPAYLATRCPCVHSRSTPPSFPHDPIAPRNTARQTTGKNTVASPSTSVHISGVAATAPRGSLLASAPSRTYPL